MYSFLSYCFFTACLTVATNYLFPNFFYELLLFVNFYYRKMKKYVKDMNKGDLKIISRDNVKDINLSIIEYEYKSESFIELRDWNSESVDNTEISIDEAKFKDVRKRVLCPNSKDSYIMASLKTNEDDIDIISDIQKLAGLYFDSIDSSKITKYLKYKYGDNKKTLLDWSYMRADGEEYTYSFKKL